MPNVPIVVLTGPGKGLRIHTGVHRDLEPDSQDELKEKLENPISHFDRGTLQMAC